MWQGRDWDGRGEEARRVDAVVLLIYNQINRSINKSTRKERKEEGRSRGVG